MGSSESKQQEEQSEAFQIPTDTLINKLRAALRFQIFNEEHQCTHSLMHNYFSQQITSNEGDSFSPKFSPFCSIFVKNSGKNDIVTCALVSPIMAIALSKNICDETGFVFDSNLTVIGLFQKKSIEIKSRKILAFKDASLVLIILDQPVWQLGWAGVTFIDQYERINELPLHMINNNSERINNIEKIEQKIHRVYTSSDLAPFRGKSARSDKGLIFQVIEKKPYLIGLQMDRQIAFFDHFVLKYLQKTANTFLTPEVQKEYLKSIDLEQLEIQGSW